MERPSIWEISDNAGKGLVGRDRELAVLRDALSSALNSRGSLVLISGEAGVGKTTIAEALLAEATAQGALALVGRCYDLAETPPYGPWAEAFARAPRVDGLSSPPDLVTGAGATNQIALFARIDQYLAAIAAQCPLVLLLDDLHWADPASLELLRVLARGLASKAMFLLVTYRDDELTRRHLLYQMLPILVRETRAIRLDLSPLNWAMLLTLVQARYALPAADGKRLATYLADRAEGNPLFSDELLRAIEDAGALARENDGWALSDLAVVGVPPLLRQVIDARIDRLGEDARRLLAVAAVVGQETSLLLWATIAGVEEDILLGLVERAAEARVLMPTADGARFTHALIREALYDGMLPLRRRAWHRLIGEALATQPRADPDAVAYQFRQAGDPRAVAWLDRAAERAFRAYAWISAVDRLEAALPLLEMAEMGAEERAWLLYRLARLLRLSDPERGLRYLEVAAPLAAGSGAAALAAYITFDRGRLAGGMITRYQHRILADMAEGIAALEALPDTERVVRGGREELWLADALSAEDPTGALAAASHTTVGMNIRLGTFVVWLGWFGRYAEALALGEQALAETAAHIPGNVYAVISAADAHQGLGYTHAAQGRPEAARAALRQSGSLNLLIGHHMLAALALIRELDMVTLVYATDDPAARERLAGQIEQALVRASGLYAEHRAPRFYRVPLLYLAGHWAEARAVAQVPENYLTWLGMIDHARGDRSDAWRLVQDALPAGPATEPGGMPLIPALGLQRLAAALALDEGDLSSAREWLEAHDRWLTWAGAVLGQAEGYLAWVAYHRAAGDTAQAWRVAEQARRIASEPRQPLALLAAHRILGELANDARSYDEAQTHLAESLLLAETCVASYERALTLLALAELDQATERRETARSSLVEARTILSALGARPALVRADVLLARLDASRASAPTPSPVVPFGLSVRELDVLRLIAEGLTDAQIAARLYVSRNTVNAHLRSIYGKLGVNTRAAAARLAVDHRLA